jgi:RNA polymerase sigma-70 factor (ECF subfamily)
MVHVTGSRDEAEDVVQDAMVQAFVKLESFQGKSAFYTWLYRIAFNVAISRKRRRRPTVSMDYVRASSGAEPIDQGVAPQAGVECEERADQVAAALQQLSEEYRIVLVLREMEDCCYETIAKMLDLPVGTVRSRLHRARSQLRQLLYKTLGPCP